MNKLNEWMVISIAILAILVIIGVVLTLIYWKRKKEGKLGGEPNYQVFFIIGIVWLPVGLIFMLTINMVIGIAFIGMGLAYLAIGLANRDRWKKKK